MITQEEKFSLGIRQREYTLINQDNLQDPVVGWYCDCTVSARTVGCCAHVATIIMYLRKGKHAQYKPKSDTSSTTVRDAAVVQTDSEMVYLTCLFF